MNFNHGFVVPPPGPVVHVGGTDEGDLVVHQHLFGVQVQAVVQLEHVHALLDQLLEPLGTHPAVDHHVVHFRM